MDFLGLQMRMVRIIVDFEIQVKRLCWMFCCVDTL